MIRRKGNIICWALLSVFIICLLILKAAEVKLNTAQQGERPSARVIRTGWSILAPGIDVMTLEQYNDVIWAGGADGVYKIDREKPELIEKIKFNTKITYVKALYTDEAGGLWIGSENGLVILKSGKEEYITDKNGLPDKRVNTIMKDSKGRIWVGTWGGAAVFDGVSWTCITTAQGLSDNMVNVVFEDSTGNIWFGAYSVPGGAVSILLDGSWQYITIKEGLPHNYICAIAEDAKKGIWVGTGFYDKGGACRFVFDDGKWTLDRIIKKQDGLAGEKVRSMFRDNMGDLWIGSEYDGVAILCGNRIIKLTREGGLSHPEVKSILQDRDGNIWLGTKEGITRIDYEALKQLKNWK